MAIHNLTDMCNILIPSLTLFYIDVYEKCGNQIKFSSNANDMAQFKQENLT